MPATLIAFDGAVECRALGAATLLCLSGREAPTPAASRRDAALLFSGLASRAELPAVLRAPVTLHDVRVSDCSAPPDLATRRCYRIDAREGVFELWAGSVQLHRSVAAAFYAVLPAERVPRGARLGWRMLLMTLRLPGAARVLSRLRR